MPDDGDILFFSLRKARPAASIARLISTSCTLVAGSRSIFAFCHSGISVLLAASLLHVAQVGVYVDELSLYFVELLVEVGDEALK
jgi:hypothetical protein